MQMQKLMPFGEPKYRRSYREHLAGPHIMRLRHWIAIRDEKKCTRCGATKALVLAHKTYDRTPNETADDVHLLCWECNRDDYIRQIGQRHYRHLCIEAMEFESEHPAWVAKIYVSPDETEIDETTVMMADWRIAA